MIYHESIIKKLSLNAAVFKTLFDGVSKEEYLWKRLPEKWCLLEVACHLYDEEREDFRARLRQVLETPDQPFPSINPLEWVKERKYIEQDFDEIVSRFLEEREDSIDWLKSLLEPLWKNAYQHPKFGPISAEMLLGNWLAHDYLHFRQITSLKYHYLKANFNVPLSYAGEW